jgi:hypothetical protein
VHLADDMCPVGDAGVEALGGSPNAGRLRILEVPGVGDRALEAIARSGHLGRLTVLRFGGWAEPAELTLLTDAGALAVARSTTLPNLAVLDRPWPREAAAGLRALAECGRLAWVGWPHFPEPDPGLSAALRSFGGLPYPVNDPRGPRRLFPWSADALT